MGAIYVPKFAVDIPLLLSIYPPLQGRNLGRFEIILMANNSVKNEDIEKMKIAFDSPHWVVSSTSSLKILAFVGGFL